MRTFTLKGLDCFYLNDLNLLHPTAQLSDGKLLLMRLICKRKQKCDNQNKLNINGSAVAQQRSITHSSALQSGEITVENSDWPTICSLSFDSSALSWPQWASVFVFMLPYSFFFSHSLGEFPTQDLFGRQTQTHCNLGSSAASASHVITGQEVKGLNQEKAQLWGSLALKYIIWVCYFKCQKNHACAVVT